MHISIITYSSAHICHYHHVIAITLPVAYTCQVAHIWVVTKAIPADDRDGSFMCLPIGYSLHVGRYILVIACLSVHKSYDQVTDNQDGSYTGAYTPTSFGLYKLAIAANDDAGPRP